MRRDALAEVLTKLLDISEYEEQPAFWLSLPYISVRCGRFRLTERSTGPEFDGVRFFAPRSNESGTVPRDVRRAWLHASPAEAVEALATAGLWPWEPGDERAPRWWCEECEGTGRAQEPGPPRGRVCLCCGVPADELAAAPRGIGHVADPPSLAALVAVASLGRPLLQRITHTLVPWIARAAGCPDARVAWRVMGRKEIEEHHRQTDRLGSNCGGRGLMYVYSHECVRRTEPRKYGDLPAWPQECPWQALPSVHETHRAWPALRALAVGDGETPQPTGVHLVALDASRIVLAVEAL